ncbi:MAG: hypothetical protein ABIG95_02435 [Candidatus Woesearchaeota archaeon]
MNISVTQISYLPEQVASRQQLYQTLPSPVQEGNLFSMDNLTFSMIAAAGIVVLILVLRR